MHALKSICYLPILVHKALEPGNVLMGIDSQNLLPESMLLSRIQPTALKVLRTCSQQLTVYKNIALEQSGCT